jgi:hypothetical protein
MPATMPPAEPIRSPVSRAMISDERQRLLSEYAATSRALSDAVERLRSLSGDVEGFIRVLGEVGTAHRACEQSRIRLKNHLARQP